MIIREVRLSWGGDIPTLGDLQDFLEEARKIASEDAQVLLVGDELCVNDDS